MDAAPPERKALARACSGQIGLSLQSAINKTALILDQNLDLLITLCKGCSDRHKTTLNVSVECQDGILWKLKLLIFDRGLVRRGEVQCLPKADLCVDRIPQNDRLKVHLHL